MWFQAKKNTLSELDHVFLIEDSFLIFSFKCVKTSNLQWLLQIQMSDLGIGMRICLIYFQMLYKKFVRHIIAWNHPRAKGFTTICEGESWSVPFRWKLCSKLESIWINIVWFTNFIKISPFSPSFLLKLSSCPLKITSPMVSDPYIRYHPQFASWSVSQSLGHRERSVASITERNSTKWMEDWAVQSNPLNTRSDTSEKK